MSHPEDGLSRERGEAQRGDRENPEANMPRAERVKQWFGGWRQGVQNKLERFHGRREVAEKSMGGVPMTEQSQAQLADIENRAHNVAEAGDERLAEVEAEVAQGPNAFEEEFGDETFYRDVMQGKRPYYPFSSDRYHYAYDTPDTGPVPEKMREAEPGFSEGMKGVRAAVLNPRSMEADARAAIAQEQLVKARVSLQELQAIAATEDAQSEVYQWIQADKGRDAMAQRMVDTLSHVDGNRRDPSWVNSVRAKQKLDSVRVSETVGGAMQELQKLREENPEQYAGELFERIEQIFDKTAQAAAEQVVSEGHAGIPLNEIQGHMQEYIAKNREIVQGYMFPLQRHNKLSPQQTEKYLQCAGEVKFLMDAYRELAYAARDQAFKQATRKE